MLSLLSSRMRQILGTLLVIYLIGFFYHTRLLPNPKYDDSPTPTPHRSSTSNSVDIKGPPCQIPRLVPWPKGVSRSPRSNFPQPKCSELSTPIFQINDHNNLIRLQPQAEDMNQSLWNGTSCYYSPVVRIPYKPDFEYEPESKTRITSSVTILDPKVEHIHVWCENGFGNENLYEDYLSAVQRKPELEAKLDAANAGKEFYSIMIIGQDSTSHMNFIRTMPKVHEFLKNKLGAVEFHGFNSLGPTTLWSINPFLSGLELIEFTNACYGNGSFNDSCPFIWKEFEEHGYRSAYSEDQASNSNFKSVGPHPFKQQPFHYDFRTVADKFPYSMTSSPFCSGPRLSIQGLLDNMQRVGKTFHDKPYWAMMWAQHLSHHENSLSKFAEPSMLSSLEYFHNKQLLNNTILIMISDHGMWWRDFNQPSEQEQAFLEQRLPMLYIALPRKFKEKYPRAAKNLRKNAQKLTTTFDVYEMMKDLLSFGEITDRRIKEREKEPSMKTRRNVSLFLPINRQRTCAMAGISMINCACLSRHNASVSEPSVIKAANFILEHINDKIKGHPECSKLELANITEVFVADISRNDNLSAKRHFVRSDGVVRESHGGYLEIGVDTKPGRGKYYVALIVNGFDGGFSIDGIARTSIYGNDADCMPIKNLKPFCYCQ